MGSVVVRAHGLVKTFGAGRAARRVLDGAELEVARGELVAVLGRSGSGQVDAAAPARRARPAGGGAIEVAGERVDGAAERAADARCGGGTSASSSSSSTCCRS